ncbi:hypothetical protein A2246_02515 [candidate division WOR-1 bacterium RIFOXYA2_FULL_37_7]|uniref:Cell envelope-related transcriptional attenuator domain-containing protein n=1 Tax=candidate division WOR-1 bacterium RIFOXYB2_FULL_37_13 TaxID=1802579 RepID=A0A1F4SRK3_UNCSA|nr:MAG: hypothetical protein A2246_02515 [candidate division WOR-1 bacterium RIFOXYA2_FULL_37_7]OGC23056.1 MAG: hypothetical protein A2310_00800 [candidate division WOR-1 bacterium RIFOXYB2_FULL_37_13]
MDKNNSESDLDLIKRIYQQNSSKKIESKNPGKRLRNILLAVVLVLIITFSSFLGIGAALFSKFMLFETLLTLMPGEKLLGETNLLILGIDDAGYGKRADTLIVANINPTKNKIGVISIPRDTRVMIKGRGLDKINHAFAYGGVLLAKQTAEELLGIKIPYYVVINLTGLKDLIDEVGGIEINVETRMYYVDYSQNLFVDLRPGLQKLSGKDAMGYVRYRSDGSDFTRIKRQQEFIKALASQISSKQNFLKSPKLLFKLFSYLDSNLNTKQVMGLALNMRKIYDYGEIKMTSISGYDDIINGVYYLEPFHDKIKELVQEYIL